MLLNPWRGIVRSACNVEFEPPTGGLHIKPFFLLVDLKHTQSVSALILRPSEIQPLLSQNYDTGSYVINSAMRCHNIHTPATYPDTLFFFFFLFSIPCVIFAFQFSLPPIYL